MDHLRRFLFRRSVDGSAPHKFKIPNLNALSPERDGLITAMVVARMSDADLALRRSRCAAKGCGKLRDDRIHSPSEGP